MWREQRLREPVGTGRQLETIYCLVKSARGQPTQVAGSSCGLASAEPRSALRRIPGGHVNDAGGVSFWHDLNKADGV